MSTTPDSAATQTFMVVGIIRDDANLAEFAALRDDEQKQLEALRSEGKIGAHYVSQPRKATFIEEARRGGRHNRSHRRRPCSSVYSRTWILSRTDA